jgi:hypothetical protein
MYGIYFRILYVEELKKVDLYFIIVTKNPKREGITNQRNELSQKFISISKCIFIT